MALVAGVDSSTQSCKVVVCDAETGAVVRSGSAPHPEGTEVHPDHWWDALQAATAAAGGLDDVEAIAVGGQQHGMVCLDEHGEVVRPALLWNDTRSAQAALDLIDELGGPQPWVDAVGLVPVASFTVTKLRWLRDAEPDNARRTAAVCLPHDYLTWRLAGARGLDALVTDRGDASGTGYWSPATGEYRRDLLTLGLGHDAQLPRVLGPSESGLSMPSGALLGPGTGDNAAAALGLGAVAGDVVVAIGAIHGQRLETANPSYLARAAVEGMLCGLADAVDAVRALGAPIERIIMVGGAARSEAVREIASAVLGLPVSVPQPGEYVARGAARQAAWVLAGGAEPPEWPLADVVETEVEPTPFVRTRYAAVREMTASRP